MRRFLNAVLMTAAMMVSGGRMTGSNPTQSPGVERP
jgi:hypothetical protein